MLYFSRSVVTGSASRLSDEYSLCSVLILLSAVLPGANKVTLVNSSVGSPCSYLMLYTTTEGSLGYLC